MEHQDDAKHAHPAGQVGVSVRYTAHKPIKVPVPNPCTVKSGCHFTRLTGADANDVAQIGDEDLAVADLAGPRGLHDGL